MENKETWFVLEEVPGANALVTIEAVKACADADVLFNAPSCGTRKAIIKGEKGQEDWIFVKEYVSTAANAIFSKILTDVNWAFWISDNIEQKSKQLMKISSQLLQKDFSKYSNEALGEEFQNWENVRRECHQFGMPWNVVEFEDQLVSKHLKSYLEEKIKEKKLDLNVASVFSVLTMPTMKSFAQREEEDLLEIALQLKNGKQVEEELEIHWKNYCWLPYMYEGPAWKKEYFQEVLSSLAKLSENELKEKLTYRKNFEAEMKQKQELLLAQLDVDEKHVKLFALAQSMVYTKALRKDALYYAYYCAENLFKQCCKRLQISIKQFRKFMPWEIKTAMEKGECNANELAKRYEFYVMYYDAKDKQTPLILTGQKARDFYASLDLKTEISDLSELKGDCACPGKATGIARVINVAEDIPKMSQGDILISITTTPDLVSAMKKASAIVTDMGGITSHAAIVSRELGIPCVIGTKVATKVFRDGHLLQVEATQGIVTKKRKRDGTWIK